MTTGRIEILRGLAERWDLRGQENPLSGSCSAVDAACALKEALDHVAARDLEIATLRAALVEAEAGFRFYAERTYGYGPGLDLVRLDDHDKAFAQSCLPAVRRALGGG